jgi:hypothetical protein
LLAALRAKVMDFIRLRPGVALSESGNPRADIFNTFGVVIIMARLARNLQFVIETYEYQLPNAALL